MKLINDFEEAVRMHEMKGTFHPEDWEKIEEDFKQTKKKLENYIKQLKAKVKWIIP